jgi:hypothetical protein
LPTFNENELVDESDEPLQRESNLTNLWNPSELRGDNEEHHLSPRFDLRDTNVWSSTSKDKNHRSFPEPELRGKQ